MPVRWPVIWFVVVLAVVAAALRVAAAAGDLWIDEVWSLDNIAVVRASGLSSDWLALYFHDNTHPLNTLYLTALGPDAPAFAYRLLAVLSGIATVIVAAAIGWRRDSVDAVIMVTVVGISYPMVHYAGEARGYAPMLFAAFSAYYLLERHLAEPGGRTLAGFVAVSLLGLAAHLTFAVALAGLGMWALTEGHARQRSLVAAVASVVPLFGLQALVLTAFGAAAWGNLVIGGDNFIPALDAAGVMTGWTLGLKLPVSMAAVTVAGFGLAAVAAMAWLYLRGERVWVMFATIIVLFPVGAVLVEREPYVLPRYFIVALPFVLILFARVLAELWHVGGLWRGAAGLLVGVFCLTHAAALQNFLAHGRGDYGRAVAAIAEVAGRQVVSGAPGFSVGSVFRYHARRSSGADRLVFAPRKEETEPADWFITGAPPLPAPAEIHRKGATYHLSDVYRHWGMSGDTWALYRRGDWRASNTRNFSRNSPGSETGLSQAGTSPTRSRR